MYIIYIYIIIINSQYHTVYLVFNIDHACKTNYTIYTHLNNMIEHVLCLEGGYLKK